MSDRPHILVVDDDRDLRESIGEYLSLHGFDIVLAEDGAAMRRRVAERRPDLVVLDLTMPGEDGLTLARWLRAQGSTGIIMLTAMAEPTDRIVGLEVGADDYIGKPFVPRELVARIRTVLRRLAPVAAPASAPQPPAHEVRFGRCVLDRLSGKLRGDDGVEEQLTGMELDLLNAFAEHPNRILSRDRLLSLAHNRDWDPLDRSIDVRITRIRKKIEPDPARPRVIKTVRGAGYIFEPGGIPSA